MSTVISAFIVTPFRRAGVINGAPTFTLYGLRRGSTCVVVGFPVVRVAVFAVRLNVGAPFLAPVALPGVTTGKRDAAVMSTVISAFIVTPFRRAGVINGAPTFTLYGLRRGSTCVVAGFPVVRMAVFAVRRSVGAPLYDARRPTGRNAACVGWNDGFSCRSDRKFCRDDRVFCQGDRFFCRRRERQNRTVCDFPHVVGRVQWTACPSCRARQAFQGIHVSTPSSG